MTKLVVRVSCVCFKIYVEKIQRFNGKINRLTLLKNVNWQHMCWVNSFMELYTYQAFITFYSVLSLFFLYVLWMICKWLDCHVSSVQLADCFEFIVIISVKILITINGFKSLKYVPLMIACPRLDTTDGPL